MPVPEKQRSVLLKLLMLIAIDPALSDEAGGTRPLSMRCRPSKPRLNVRQTTQMTRSGHVANPYLTIDLNPIYVAGMESSAVIAR